MNFFKKLGLIGLALIFTVTLVACSGTSSSSTSSSSSSKESGYVPKKLTVQFVPSSQAETIEAKAKPLEKLLKKQLGIPVSVSVSTDYNTIIEAMSSKQVDVGFLPPNAYVLAHDQKAANVLLQAERYKITQPGGKNSDVLTKSYRSMIVVKKGSKIKNLADLKGKTIAVQDVTSASGYIWPAAEMKEKGIDVEKDCKTVQVKGHDQGVLAVLNGDADAAFVFEDARNVVKKDVPDIFNKVEPIYFTKGIPNDTISVRSDMNATWSKKISDAFIAIGKSKEGRAIISAVYSHEGYVRSKDSNFDIVRKYDKIIGQN